MTGRPPLAALAIAATLIAAAAAWWPSAAGEETGTVETSPIPPEAAASAKDPDASATDVGQGEALPPLETEDDGFTDDDLWAQISDPVNSDLPPDLFAELSELAGDFVRADATGEGREHWAQYRLGNDQAGRAAPCCSRVEIHAAAALRDDGSSDRVRAVVIWSGWRGHDPLLVETSTVVTLVHDGAMWTAIRD